jgi:putative transposase
MRTSTLDHSRPGGKRKMQRFKLPGSPRRFLAAHAVVYKTFNIQRHLISRPHPSPLQGERDGAWQAATARDSCMIR